MSDSEPVMIRNAQIYTVDYIMPLYIVCAIILANTLLMCTKP